MIKNNQENLDNVNIDYKCVNNHAVNLTDEDGNRHSIGVNKVQVVLEDTCGYQSKKKPWYPNYPKTPNGRTLINNKNSCDKKLLI